MADDATNTEAPAKGSVLKDWVLPIVIGLLAGGALLKLVPSLPGKVAGAFQSNVARLVEQWDPYSDDAEWNDNLEKQIKDLGRPAREDLLSAFRAIKPGQPGDFDEDDHKLWAGQILGRDPFSDTRSLVEIARDKNAPHWDRRLACAVLVDVLGKDVDPETVADPLLDWVEDLSLLEHSIPVQRLKSLRNMNILPPDRDPRLIAGLLKIVETAVRPGLPDDEVAHAVIAGDRQIAMGLLGPFMKANAAVKGVIWKIALDAKDNPNARVTAVRLLSENNQFEEADVALWKEAAETADDLVRQCAAENLFRSGDPTFNAVLAKMHKDRAEFVRAGSLDAQIRRKAPTMLDAFDELMEDYSPSVRWQAMLAAGRFKDNLDGIGARQAQILRVLERSTEESDVMGAVLALNMMTGKSFGFAPSDIDLARMDVAEAAVAAFIADADGRKIAVKAWRDHLGGTVVWSDGDREKTLRKLLVHADPENVRHAKVELGMEPRDDPNAPPKDPQK